MHMDLKLFKICFYIILTLFIIIFYTKDLNIFGNKFYKNIKEISNASDTDVLVNKNFKLSKNYVPNNLVLLDLKYSNKYKYLQEEAYESFKNLSNKAKELGYKIIIVSAYRSYFYQQELYDYYVDKKGKEYADLCSARPGHSEHQTGLAIDVMGSNNDYDEFEKAIEFEWMKENAHKYGFILRYPKGKEYITGFKYEPWHYRYVGKDIAKYIYDKDITLEEYKKMKK